MGSVIGAARTGTARRWGAAVLAVGTAAALVLSGGISVTSAWAQPSAQSAVGLGTATSFAVLAGSTVTNTGLTIVSGDLGVSPGTAITGFPPGLVINGTQHAGDAVALQAQSDLTTAYNDAAGRTPATAVSSDLGGQTLLPGVYNSASELGLTGTLTLDAQGDPEAVFIFQAGSTLITAPNSTVALINGADPCNVFWQVGSSATLDTNTTFVGSVLALTSISLNTATSVTGRVLARNGAVTLDNNMITRPDCDTLPPGDGGGNGDGDGEGPGDGNGDGEGPGDGNGDREGPGDGNGDREGPGDGNGDGEGPGDGNGSPGDANGDGGGGPGDADADGGVDSGGGAGQVKDKPVGGVDTGDGSSTSGMHYLLGGLVLGTAGGAVLIARSASRRVRQRV